MYKEACIGPHKQLGLTRDGKAQAEANVHTDKRIEVHTHWAGSDKELRLAFDRYLTVMSVMSRLCHRFKVDHMSQRY